ncbi:MAG: molecular chaperone DnaJ [Candidatus Woesearchaeota archaeon]
MTKEDYYEILGIPGNASKEEIKKAYKNLAKKYHPDITKDKSTEAKFKEVSEAYAVLSDDQKRAQYDQFGHEGFDQRFSQEDIFRNFNFDVFRDFGFGDFDNIFDVFFGGRRTRRRGADLRYDLEVAFEESAFGTKKQIQIPRNEICSTCEGSGAHNNNFENCNTCNGSGKVRQAIRTPFGAITQVATCNKCHGEGKLIKERCKTCKGRRIIEKTRTISVKIPAGVNNGNQIRLAGEGEAIENGTTGDLYVVLHVLPHKLFQREGDDIYLDIPIKFTTAILGAKIEVPTLEGKAKLKIPAGTQSHTIFKLKGLGIKRLQGYGQGDQYVRTIVNIPKTLNKTQKKLLSDLDKSFS